MSFIGNVPAEAYSPVAKDTFSGDDSTTDFTLSIPATTNSVEVLVENVQQEPTTAYTISGTTLSFTAAPVTGTNNIYVIHRGPAVQQVTPPAGVAIDASTVTASGDVSIADKIVHTGDTNTAIRFPAADTVTVETGGSEAMRIDSSGNVGIGTTSPASQIHSSVNSETSIARFENTAGALLDILADSNRLYLRDSTSGTDNGVILNSTDNQIEFRTNTTEQMRLDSSGNLKFNSGYGSAATAYGVRAWVKFQGEGAVTINEDGNVSSVSDDGTGKYTINFSNSMPDTNYIYVSGLQDGGGFNDARTINHEVSSTYTTSAFSIFMVDENQALNDLNRGHIAFIR